jgi:negative regulator of replication initiation
MEVIGLAPSQQAAKPLQSMKKPASPMTIKWSASSESIVNSYSTKIGEDSVNIRLHNADLNATAATAATAAEEVQRTSAVLQSPPFQKWVVGNRYEIFRLLGSGSYGEVAEAIDHM